MRVSIVYAPPLARRSPAPSYILRWIHPKTCPTNLPTYLADANPGVLLPIPPARPAHHRRSELPLHNGRYGLQPVLLRPLLVPGAVAAACRPHRRPCCGSQIPHGDADGRVPDAYVVTPRDYSSAAPPRCPRSHLYAGAYRLAQSSRSVLHDRGAPLQLACLAADAAEASRRNLRGDGSSSGSRGGRSERRGR